MLLNEISPYIRYAGASAFHPARMTVVAYDARLFYIAKGSGKVLVRKKEYPFCAGTVLLWQAGNPYRFLPDGGPAEAVVLNFDYTQNNRCRENSFPPSPEEAFQPERMLERVRIADCPALDLPYCAFNAQYVESDLRQIVYEVETKRPFYRERASALLKKAIADLARSEIAGPSGAEDKIERILRFIRENYARDIDNSRLAALISYHPYYLNRLMAACMGTTLHRYLADCRLAAAERMLLSTGKTVARIAEECGFHSVSYFSNSFKKKYGMSPSFFRSAAKNRPQ